MVLDSGKNEKDGFLHRLVNGDRLAFADFVKKYQQDVFLCCRTLGLNYDESQDVASEAFLGAYQGIRRFAGKSKLDTWLWKITYHKAINYLRGKIRNQNLQEYLQKNYNEECPNQNFNENNDYVWDAVKKLPPEQALTIVLFYRQEKSIKEIAKIMNKNQNTVKTDLFRGREKLKDLLSGKLERLGNAAER
ncbi:MAG: RNA polymerase sigma factor [Phycisphaerales bacterium]